MKKILFFLLLFPLFVGSCSSDDDDDYIDDYTFTETDIIGTWVFQDCVFKSLKTNNSKADGPYREALKRANTYAATETYIFEANGNFTGFRDSFKVEGTYRMAGKSIILTQADGTTLSRVFTFTRNTFSYDINETQEYQALTSTIVPDLKDVIIYEAITTSTFKKQ